MADPLEEKIRIIDFINEDEIEIKLSGKFTTRESYISALRHSSIIIWGKGSEL